MDFIDTLLNQMSSTFNREGAIPIQAEISMDETFKWRALKNNQFASRSKKVRFSKNRLKEKEKIDQSNNYSENTTHSCSTINGLNQNDSIEIEIENDISRAEIQEIVAITQGIFSVTECLNNQSTDIERLSGNIDMIDKSECNLPSLSSSTSSYSIRDKISRSSRASNNVNTIKKSLEKPEINKEISQTRNDLSRIEKIQPLSEQVSSGINSIFVQMSYTFNGSISNKLSRIEENSIDSNKVHEPNETHLQTKDYIEPAPRGLNSEVSSQLQENLRRSGRLKRDQTSTLDYHDAKIIVQTIDEPTTGDTDFIRISSDITPKFTRSVLPKQTNKSLNSNTNHATEKKLRRNRHNRYKYLDHRKKDCNAIKKLNQLRVPQKICSKQSKGKICALSKKATVLHRQSSYLNNSNKHSIKQKSAASGNYYRRSERKSNVLSIDSMLLKSETQKNNSVKPLRRLLNVENNMKHDLLEHKGRLSRPIKLSAKILANAELRHGFELQNTLRLSINTEMKGKTNPKKCTTTLLPDSSKKQNLIAEKRRLSITRSDINKSFDLSDFLDEIKRQNLGNKRSPENRKLNKKQQKRLLKLKEMHFKMLGLRKINVVSKQQYNNSSVIEDLHNVTVEVNTVNNLPDFTNKQKQNENRCSSIHTDDEAASSETVNRDDSDEVKIIYNDSLANLHTLSDSNAPQAIYGMDSTLFINQPRCICYCQKRTRYFTTKATNRMMCTATDDINGESFGCTAQLEGDLQNFLRVNNKTSYQLLCHTHRNRLRHHGCCPVCGIFCTKGVFVMCGYRHIFHQRCAESRNTDTENSSNGNTNDLFLKCPHCGTENATHKFTIKPKQVAP
ncbi:uncharacterized protein LOC128742525 [Sabethes cyaneus]|uniref:uncharacterized protein LOC128742525 n=1 Tax=Sabethes cyaneus TaxID=53552 RepID=UPI00237ED345|nr:uncharacterized protein LOC128742525 [Sabethes cyaneus]XP_053694895.1 uncharacterized protein LOC128742525 [Sabethes cyaneus]